MANPLRRARPLRDNMLERGVPQVCLVCGRAWTPPPTKALGPIGPTLPGDTCGVPQERQEKGPFVTPDAFTASLATVMAEGW